MMRSSVVLPEPEGPSSATSSPSSHMQIDVAQCDVVRERLADVARFDSHGYATSSITAGRSSARMRHSSAALAIRVTSASSASRLATANAAEKLYSL